MVMGVDVGHGVTSSKSPSVAAVVGSQDPACTQYTAAILEQTPGHEVVLGIREAATDLLQRYRSSRGKLPEAILVFRDGVSDSQYAAVLQQEVADIRAACAAMEGATAPPKVWRAAAM
jgi:eukaryotic translation initiation factor 2C